MKWQVMFKQVKIPRILLSIIDLLKTAARMGILLRGHRDDSQYHPEVEEPATHAGVGNFVELLNFAVRQGKKDLEDHLKNCSSGETYISKTTQNNLLNFCYDLMTEAIINKVKQAIFFQFYAMKLQIHLTKSNFLFA